MTNKQQQYNREFTSMVESISSNNNILFFPVRLETHFRHRNGQKELCVRIFPDEVMLDYLTDRLTQKEYDDGVYFWLQWFIASGSDKREYEAWMALCEKYELRRAAWIVRLTRPASIDLYREGGRFYYRRPYLKLSEVEESLESIYAHLADIHLDEQQKKNSDTLEYQVENEVRTHLNSVKDSLAVVDRYVMGCDVVVDYLYDTISFAVEYLQGRLENIRAFYERFANLYKNNCRQMELWDMDYTILSNLQQDVAVFRDKLQQKRITLSDMVQHYQSKLENEWAPQGNDDPFFPQVEIKSDDTPDFPVADLLPDRFVVLAEPNVEKNKLVRCYGNPVNHHIKLGLVPTGNTPDESPLQIDAQGNLQVSGGLEWMFDYDQAEAAGMAITVPISESITGFNYLYVVGIRKHDHCEQTYLRHLFMSHVYGTDGMRFLEVGTPTNMVEGASTRGERDEAQMMRRQYDIEVNDLYLSKTLGTDAYALSERLHPSLMDAVGHIDNYDNHELSDSQMANILLWHHFTDHILENDNVDEGFKGLIQWLGNELIPHLSGRGHYPSFQIGDQPYGIVPATDFLHLMPSTATTEQRTACLVYDTLLRLADQWKELRKNQVHAASNLRGSDADKHYLEMAGQTPFSVTMQEKTMVDSPSFDKEQGWGGNPSSQAISNPKQTDGLLGYADLVGLYRPVGIDGTEKEADLTPYRDLLRKKLPTLTDEKADMLIAEFFDLFTHRLDAWFEAMLFSMQEERDPLPVPAMQEERDPQPAPAIGAYGWVFNLQENVRTPLSDAERAVKQSAMQLPEAQPDIYSPQGTDRPECIMTPSVQHAITAAILRSAYLKTRGTDTDSHMCINLSSMRARQALRMVEGIRQGLSTGVVLGYDLERYLHEAYKLDPQCEMDRYIYPLRRLFPLTIDLASETSQANDYVMEVLNGEALLNTFLDQWDGKDNLHIWMERNRKKLEWYQLLSQETSLESNSAHRTMLFKMIERMADSYDALNDLLLAEGVHRLVMGDRASYNAIATFMAKGTGNVPRPAILDAPLERVAVSHKASFLLPSRPKGDKTALRPLALAEPAVNAWVEQLVGPMEGLYCLVQHQLEGSEPLVEPYTLRQLDIQPSEYLYLSATRPVLDRLLELRWRLLTGDCGSTVTIVHDPSQVTAAYIPLDDSKLSLHDDEIRAKELRALVLRGRPMRASDWVVGEDSDATERQATDLDDLRRRLESLEAHTSFLASSLSLKVDSLSQREALDDDALLELYALLAQCLECGLSTEVPAFDSGLFLFKTLDGKPAYHIDPVSQRLAYDETVAEQKAFLASLTSLVESLRQRLSAAEAAKQDASTPDALTDAIRQLTLPNLKVLPRFTLQPLYPDADRLSAVGRMAQYPAERVYRNVTPERLFAWQEEMGDVRSGMKRLNHLDMFQTMVGGAPLGTPAIVQLRQDGELRCDQWLGLEVDSEALLDDADTLLLFCRENLTPWQTGRADAEVPCNVGLVFDSWLEYIPYRKAQAGLAFKCDQPDNEAPQALLMGIHPLQVGASEASHWTLDVFLNMFDSIRFMLQNRAVEPDLIYHDPTLSRLLPLLSDYKNLMGRLSATHSSAPSSAQQRMATGTIFDSIPGGEILNRLFNAITQ